MDDAWVRSILDNEVGGLRGGGWRKGVSLKIDDVTSENNSQIFILFLLGHVKDIVMIPS